ncbi:hypothetical protein OPV22_031031 [Ensete ventricosum]|uniref:Uncharacterized protein n=1 Tax=Ensete ventricosum TaxID=4639 RepID=A0AAV8PLF2_ENSVE|nr:hypothetical protein OPV22_031031 [Ensete ventricosum]
MGPTILSPTNERVPARYGIGKKCFEFNSSSSQICLIAREEKHQCKRRKSARIQRVGNLGGVGQRPETKRKRAEATTIIVVDSEDRNAVGLPTIHAVKAAGLKGLLYLSDTLCDASERNMAVVRRFLWPNHVERFHVAVPCSPTSASRSTKLPTDATYSGHCQWELRRALLLQLHQFALFFLCH